MSITNLLLVAAVIPLLSCNAQDRYDTFKVQTFSSYSSEEIPPEIKISIDNIKYDSIFKEVYSVASGNSNPDVFFYETWFDDIAFSVIDPSGRYIFYNRGKFDSLVQTMGNTQGVRSIIAHELSHLLNNHPLRYTPSSKIFEKEADYYSGRILREFQASISESIEAMLLYGNEIETNTHPVKGVRINEIKRGWINESFKIFKDHMVEFDSMIYESAKKDFFDDSDMTKRLDEYFNNYLTSRERFVSLIDSIGLNESSIHVINGIEDTSRISFSSDLIIALSDKEFFKADGSKSTKESFDLDLTNFQMAIVYDIPIIIREDKIFNLQMEEMGSIESLNGVYQSKLLLEKREYLINKSNEIIAFFPDGSKSKVGMKLN